MKVISALEHLILRGIPERKRSGYVSPNPETDVRYVSGQIRYQVGDSRSLASAHFLALAVKVQPSVCCGATGYLMASNISMSIAVLTGSGMAQRIPVLLRGRLDGRLLKAGPLECSVKP